MLIHLPSGPEVTSASVKLQKEKLEEMHAKILKDLSVLSGVEAREQETADWKEKLAAKEQELNDLKQEYLRDVEILQRRFTELGEQIRQHAEKEI